MKVFNNAIFKPIFLAINAEYPHAEMRNAKDPLADAVTEGRVDYDGTGIFTGNFNAAISRQLKALGARYSILKQGWILSRDKVPVSVSIAKANADESFTKLRKIVMKTLDDSTIDSVFAHHFQHTYLQEKYEQAIEWMNDDFKKTVKAITIAPTLTPAQKKIIAEEWTNNLKLYIRGWTKENIVTLRDKVQKLAFAGQRSQNMIKLIQDNYGVSRNKAKFLARQETSLLLSKFREERYKDVGVQKYQWQTSGDQRVRDDHEHLDGKIFLFDQPPVCDRRTGRRANPGEDFNCRCVARPIWE
jgi:SPP1 gp7 family putative phage head morphogenesis protein